MKKTRYLFVVYFITYISISLNAQKTYTFNNPNSTCYFQYVCYTIDGAYNDSKKPIIFILGANGESAQQTFDNDALRNVPQFFGYLFVYVPNKGETSKEKLLCLPSLVSLLTYGVFGRSYSNLFCFIKDETIIQTDIDNTDFKDYFKSVKLATPAKAFINESISQTSTPGVVADENSNLLNDFKAEVIISKTEKPKPISYKGPPLNFNFTLSGKVVDANTYEGIPFAVIALQGKPIGTTTNADGAFSILNVPTDTNTLIVTYLGYKKTSFKLTPLHPKTNTIIEIEPASSQLNEVVVVSEREELMNASSENLSVIKMSPSKLSQLPNIGEKDIMRSFQLMPGVSASNESSSGLYVRGGTPDQNLVLYDGFTVYQVDHLYGFYSAFNSNAIKDVQLYKGGFPSRFGGRLSAVSEITGKDGNQKKINIGGDVSLLSFNVFAEVPITKKLTFLGAFRRSFQSPLYKKIANQFTSQQSSSNGGRSFNTTVISYFYDLNSKLTYRPNEKDIFSLSVYNGTDKLSSGGGTSGMSPPGGGSSSFSVDRTDASKYGNLGSSLKWSRKWNNRLYGNTLASYSNFYSNRENSTSRTITESSGSEVTRKFGTFETNNLKDFSLKSDYTFDILDNNQLGGGVFATYYDIAYNYSQNDTSSILNRHNYGVLTGAYLEDRIKLMNGKFVLLPGIRASYFSTTSKTYYEPRMSATYNLNSQISLKAATGRYYQFANQVTREDILNGNKTFWILSDGSNVPVSQALHYIAGVSYNLKNYLFSVEGWYKDLSGLTQHTLRFNTSPTSENYSENFYKGTGYSQGLEFLAQKKAGNFSGWISYTLSKTRSKFQVYQPGYYAADQDVPNEFKVVGIYKYKKFVFSATWIYATGRPYTAPSGAYSLTLLDGTSQDYYTVSSKNTLRLPDYHRLDIAASYQFKSPEGRDIGSLGISFFNLYNRKNIWYKEYQIVDKQIVETNVQYLGFTPNITLSLKLR